MFSYMTLWIRHKPWWMCVVEIREWAGFTKSRTWQCTCTKQTLKSLAGCFQAINPYGRVSAFRISMQQILYISETDNLIGDITLARHGRNHFQLAWTESLNSENPPSIYSRLGDWQLSVQRIGDDGDHS